MKKIKVNIIYKKTDYCSLESDIIDCLCIYLLLISDVESDLSLTTCKLIFIKTLVENLNNYKIFSVFDKKKGDNFYRISKNRSRIIDFEINNI